MMAYRFAGSWMREVNVTWRLRKIALGFDEARLQVDDIVSELVVLCLQRFVVFAQQGVVSNLLFEFLDMSFFALSEGAL